MRTIIFRTIAPYLASLMVLFSIFVLLRGHNQPGGGFIGGLLAASAFLLLAIAYDVERSRRTLRIPPRFLMGGGLLVALGSGLWAVLSGGVFMTGLWWQDFTIPVMGGIKLGTPFLFDCGVFLVVLGITVEMAFHIMEDC